MTTLAIDTCLTALTLGLELDGGAIVSSSKEIGIGHAEALAPAFHALLAEAGIEAGTITRIGVTVGPGSFMGQRVGIAFAKGLAMGSGAVTVPMTTLAALSEEAGGGALAVIDARRGQAYLQDFTDPSSAPALVSHDEARAAMEGFDRGPLAGSGAATLLQQKDAPTAAGAEALLRLTARLPAAPLRTLYLRAPDAKPPARPSL